MPMLGLIGYDIGYGFDPSGIGNDNSPWGWDHHLILEQELINLKRLNMKSSFIILLLAFVGSLFSNDLKIGYIDSQKILSELEEVRAVQIELEKTKRMGK